MKMPNNEQSFIADNKIENYLLSDTHVDGKHKAAFFKRFGFDSTEPETFKDSLLDHAVTREVVNTIQDTHGTKYVLECELKKEDLIGQKHLKVLVFGTIPYILTLMYYFSFGMLFFVIVYFIGAPLFMIWSFFANVYKLLLDHEE